MALATRCPDCQAVFRVVSDQLKLRGGLVRCGNCRHVFDAIGSLSYIEEAVLGAPPAASPPPSPSPAPAVTPSAAGATTEAASAPARADMTTSSAAAPTDPRQRPAVSPRRSAAPPIDSLLPDAASAAAATPPPREPAPSPAPDPLAVPTLLAPRPDPDEDTEAATRAADDNAAEAPADATDPADTAAAEVAGEPTAVERSEPALAPARDRRRVRASSPAAEAVDPDADAPRAEEPDTAEVAFLKESRPSRGFSIVYGGGSLLLALLLALQATVLFRTEILTRWPELRPRLVGLCELYGCSVGWPTRADLLAVVGTELQAVPGTDILELTAVIRNRAAFRVALPAVEVTLTDTTNRTLARKVFAPVDYLASAGEPSSRINEGIGAGSDFIVRITFEARGLNAAGFVVYPFYL